MLRAEQVVGDSDETAIVIPYKPRKHFISLHRSPKRWKFVVAHRRAGKSVAEINEVIKKALENPREYPPPRYAYVGPSFAQTKDLIWGYAKHYTSPFRGMDGYNTSEGDLQITLPNGAMINLYGGAAAYERMRGLYFDGIVLDEFPLLNPAVFSTVVRPCLADYRGWAIVSGTSNGDDHFHALKKKNQKDDTWDFFIIPVNETDALHPDEVIEMTKDMSPEEYAREMMCSFDAPIEGAYFGFLMNQAESKGRICDVPYEPKVPVITWWDLGIRDMTAVWFVQRVGQQLRFIDYFETNQKGIKELMAMVHGTYVDPFTQQVIAPWRQEYVFGVHNPPFDVEVKELGTGRMRIDVMRDHARGVPILASPNTRHEDSIEAARQVISVSWFDRQKCEQGVSALRNYHKKVNGQPDHNWASHGAAAYYTGAVNTNNTFGLISSSNVVALGGRSLRRRIRGMV